MRSFKTRTDESISMCLEVAMSIVELVNDIIGAGQLYRAYWVCVFIYSGNQYSYLY